MPRPNGRFGWATDSESVVRRAQGRGSAALYSDVALDAAAERLGCFEGASERVRIWSAACRSDLWVALERPRGHPRSMVAPGPTRSASSP